MTQSIDGQMPQDVTNYYGSPWRPKKPRKAIGITAISLAAAGSLMAFAPWLPTHLVSAATLGAGLALGIISLTNRKARKWIGVTATALATLGFSILALMASINNIDVDTSDANLSPRAAGEVCGVASKDRWWASDIAGNGKTVAEFAWTNKPIYPETLTPEEADCVFRRMGVTPSAIDRLVIYSSNTEETVGDYVIRQEKRSNDPSTLDVVIQRKG